MEADDLKFCIVCGNELDIKVKGNYHLICYQRLYRKRKRNKPKEKITFPVWTCINGHQNQLDFDPIRNRIAFDNYYCKDCGVSTKNNTYESGRL